MSIEHVRFNNLTVDLYAGTAGVTDTLVLAKNLSDLNFTWNESNNSWYVNGNGYAAVLASIERVQLLDRTITLGVGGPTKTPAPIVAVSDQANVPIAAGLTGGGYVLSWTSSSIDGSPNSTGIAVQRYTVAGEQIGAVIRANTTLAGAQDASDTTGLVDGGFVVSWTTPDAQGYGDIALQRFAADGSRIGSETIVNSTLTGNQMTSRVVALSDGGYAVSWQSVGTGPMVQKFDASGARIGSETLLPTNGGTVTEMVALANGGFLAYSGSGNNLRIQTVAADGSLAGDAAQITLTGAFETPVMSAVSDGYVLSYRTSAGLTVRRFDVAGREIGTTQNFTRSLPAGSSVINFAGQVVELAGGGLAVVWRETGTVITDGVSRSSDLMVLQMLGADGGRIGLPRALDLPTAMNALSLTALAGGGFVLTASYSGSGSAVRTFDADGFPLLPSLTGSDAPDTLNATQAMRLEGGAGNDVLTGWSLGDILVGGAGADRLIGGSGDDSYIVDEDDRIVETANGGIDTVYVADSYTLTAANVENLVLTGNAAASLIGSSIDNVLVGNAADNSLNGALGADRMVGGRGNDTYYVDNIGDVVVEEAGEGIDTVVAQTSYTLGANVENLRLIGAGAISGTGNALDNQIYGNALDNVLSGGVGNDLLVGGRGNDNYYVDARDQLIELSGEGIDTVYAAVGWALGANLENLTLLDNGLNFNTGNINATGNDLANVLIGNSFRNVLDGGAGADRMDGGAGNDIYYVDNLGDIASETAIGDLDEVRTTVSYTLLANIERLTLLGTADLDGTGNDLANLIRGNGGNNVLVGGGGVDTLIGGAGDDRLISSDGLDTLRGGLGDDSYVVSAAIDEIIELRNQGVDTVIATVTTSYTLSNNLERLILIGGNVDGYGNTLANEITGTEGINLIDGGRGADTMIGLGGDDTYVVDHRGDVVVEAAGGGIDTVMASVTYTLTDDVENLVLTGSAGLAGTGNALANIIWGNETSNTLRGGDGDDVIFGAGGGDLLFGEAGDDMLFGTIGDDRINGGDGIDTASYYYIPVGVTVNLSKSRQDTGAGSDTILDIENVDGSNGGDDVLTGNTGNNVLRGHDGNDTLSGGAGNDVLLGGEGDDLILADGGADLIDGGNGIDRLSYATIRGSVRVDLNLTEAQQTGAGLDTIRGIEKVDGSATGDDRLVGDANANVLAALGGNDVLIGGDGADTLDGGDGIDTADYSTAPDDVVIDLSRGLANDGFGSQDVLIGIENAIGGQFDDVLIGDARVNVLTGGLGRDLTTGGAGADVFAFLWADDSGLTADTRDVITDFVRGVDKIDLSAIDANAATPAIDDFTAVIAAGTAFAAAGQLRFEGGVLYGNTDADADAEFSIQVDGVTTLTLGDFLF